MTLVSRPVGSDRGELSYQLGEGPIAHAALLERHDEVLSGAMPRDVASLHGIKELLSQSRRDDGWPAGEGRCVCSLGRSQAIGAGNGAGPDSVRSL